MDIKINIHRVFIKILAGFLISTNIKKNKELKQNDMIKLLSSVISSENKIFAIQYKRKYFVQCFFLYLLYTIFSNNDILKITILQNKLFRAINCFFLQFQMKCLGLQLINI